MMFPKGFHYKKEKDLFEWWGIGISLPYISTLNFYELGTTYQNYEISAPTCIGFATSEFYHKFEARILGFGFWYAKQWGY